jgi:hypothetical protein
MRLSPELKRVLEIGSTQVIHWMEHAQSDGYSLKSLENAQDFLHVCIQALKHEKANRPKKKNPQEENVHFLSDYNPKGPITFH